jgi:hypothetical protein
LPPAPGRSPPENWCGRSSICPGLSPTRASSAATCSQRSAPRASPCVASTSATISPAVWRGLSEEYGSWNTICMFRRSLRTRRSGKSVMSWPSSRTRPELGRVRRHTVRPTVDLPQPLSPTSPSVSPGAIAKVTPSTARTTPRRTG